jgi:hypothetical protein
MRVLYDEYQRMWERLLLLLLFLLLLLITFIIRKSKTTLSGHDGSKPDKYKVPSNAIFRHGHGHERFVSKEVPGTVDTEWFFSCSHRRHHLTSLCFLFSKNVSFGTAAGGALFINATAVSMVAYPSHQLIRKCQTALSRDYRHAVSGLRTRPTILHTVSQQSSVSALVTSY